MTTRALMAPFTLSICELGYGGKRCLLFSLQQQLYSCQSHLNHRTLTRVAAVMKFLHVNKAITVSAEILLHSVCFSRPELIMK